MTRLQFCNTIYRTLQSCKEPFFVIFNYILIDMNICQTESLSERELDTKNRYKSKQCPCGKTNADGKFVPDIGYEKEGYCHSCSRTIRSSQKPNEQLIKHHLKLSQLSPTFLSTDMLNTCLQKPMENNFSKFLVSTFGAETAKQLIKTYSIGTSDYWEGATAFPQIDIDGNIRTGKIILYDQTSGKRVKQPINHIQWLHTISKNCDFNLKQSFFWRTSVVKECRERYHYFHY